MLNRYLNKTQRKIFGYISLKPKSQVRSRILISYKTDAFVLSKTQLGKVPHTNTWESGEIVNILLKKGFAVDIIDWNNKNFTPTKKYDLFIDINNNLDRLSPTLDRSCTKVFIATGAHWAFQNHAEHNRIRNLKERRNIEIEPRRTIESNHSAEKADYIIVIGNDFTKNTYSFLHKPIFPINVSTTNIFNFPEEKNFDKCKKNFVWLGGGGAVHKGLDLVLEVFSSLPDYNLFVCGPVSAEKDFEKFYYKELYETKNIKTLGRINIKSEEFKNIIDSCVALIHPSCSEGQSGSVIAGMHAGLIPIASYESGVNLENFGEELKTCTMEEIEKSIRMISTLPNDELKRKSKLAWNYARKNNTRENFSKRFKEIIDTIIAEKKL